MNHFTSEILTAAPVAESARLIDFETAEVRPGFVNGTYFLTVTNLSSDCLCCKNVLVGNTKNKAHPAFQTEQKDIAFLTRTFGIPTLDEDRL